MFHSISQIFPDSVTLTEVVHPSISIQFRVAGGLEPILAIIVQEAGYTSDRSSVCCRASKIQRIKIVQAENHSTAKEKSTFSWESRV